MYRLTWRSVMCLPDNQGSPAIAGGTLIETAQAAHLTGHPNCRQAAIVVVAAELRCFLGGSLKACERALHSGHDLGSHAEVEIVLAEERDQHFGPGSADDRMSAGVGGVWGGVADLGKPVEISVGVRVSVRSGCANCGYRSPEIVSVFGIVEGDDPIGETEVEQ